MKTLKYSIFLWICFSLLFVTHKAKAFEEVTKKISEKYQVSSVDKLSIDNRHGKVDIYTWDKNEITVEITMKAWAGSVGKAQDELDRISVKYGKSGNFITFETQISGNNVNINDNRGFEINYVVNMPKSNPLKLTNKYGAAFLDNFSGDLELSVKYGKLRTSKLTGTTKNIEIAYGGIDSEEIQKGRLKISYSDAKIRNAGTIELDNAYGKIYFDRVGTLQIDVRYGELRVDESAGSISGKASYSGVRVRQLTKSFSMEVRYGGSFSLDKIAKGFEKIELEGGYTSFDLTFESGANFDFNVNTAYGSFKNGLEGAEINKQIESNNSKEFEGYVGKKGSGAAVKVSTRYGSVKFSVIKPSK
jgi:hypothetical protein